MEEEDLLEPGSADVATLPVPAEGDGAVEVSATSELPEQVNIVFPVRVEVVGQLSDEDIARVTEAVLAELLSAIEDGP